MYILAGAVLLFGLVPFLAVRLYATRVARANESVPDRLHRLERLQQVTSFSLPILSILAVFQFGLIERITAGLESIAPGISTLPGADSVLSVAVIFAMATLPIIGVVLGLYPTTRSLRDTSASPFRVVRNTVAGIAMTAVVIGLAVGGILAITSVVGSSLPVLIGGVCLVIFAVFGLTPYLIVLFQDRVPLEGARRDRIERLCGDLGYEPRGLYLLEGESTKTANAMVAGTVPGLRYVFLTDYLLEECSDDELRAILAHEFGHVAGRHLWQRGLLTVGVIVAAVVAAEPLGITALEAQFGFAGFFVPVMAGYIVYHVFLLGGLAYWQEYRADAYAARHAGPDATANALKVLATANDSTREAGLLYSLATHHPPIAARVEAVQRSADDLEADSGSATGG
ncbi:M48 family metalloprotease [Natronolimnobius baerhuensis]|uniref:Peptidase M48 n=1 Tax=Natronolimnobius baerhuensis TaxID=253108 RepID=A0A202E8S8_9EURY|nr:M48 family metalloprotease [Natronolimnobius baerhuensis]OVE84619.1 peptidase M48 [Natronolimnobius baerhuensis]